MFKKVIFLLGFLCLLLSSSAQAQFTKVGGYAEQGGNVIVTSGVSSTTKAQKSFPLCTVTIYAQGTTNLSTIYSDSTGTAKANPFTADSTGYWFFYAASGRYDVKFSGTGISSPFTISDFTIGSSGGGGSGITSLNALTGAIQTFAVGTSGTDFNISSTGTTHTYNIPSASDVARGLVSVTTQTFAGNKTLTGITKLGLYATSNEPAFADTGSSYTLLGGADSNDSNRNSTGSPSVIMQTYRSGGTAGIGVIDYGFASYKKAGEGDTYTLYALNKYGVPMTGFAGSYYQHALRAYMYMAPTDVNGQLIGYGAWVQAERTVSGIRAVGMQLDTNNGSTDASMWQGSKNNTFNLATNYGAGGHNTAIIYSQGDKTTGAYAGWLIDRNSITQRAIDYTLATHQLQGTWAATNGSATVTGTSGNGDVEVVKGDILLINGTYATALVATQNSITLSAVFAGSTGSGLTITKAIQPAWIANQSYVMGNALTLALSGTWAATNGSATLTGTSGAANTETTAGDWLFIGDEWGIVVSATANAITLNANFTGTTATGLSLSRYRRYSLLGITSANTISIDPEGINTRFGGDVIVSDLQTNKVTLKSLNIAGTFYPGIWFGSATPSSSNYGFLSDVAAGLTVLNAPTGIDLRIGNSGAWQITNFKHFVPLVANLDVGASANPIRNLYTSSYIFYGATAFASLGTPANGAVTYCNDCTIASPCASGGTGAIAKRLNSTWVCN